MSDLPLRPGHLPRSGEETGVGEPFRLPTTRSQAVLATMFFAG